METIRTVEDPRWPEVQDRIVAAAQNATVIWDFDGVIADTEPLHALTYRLMLKRYGHEVDEDFFSPFVGHYEGDTWRLFAEAGWPVEENLSTLIQDRRELFVAQALVLLQPTWLVQALAPQLATVAKAQYCVSAGDAVSVASLLSHWDLAPLVPPHPRPAHVSKKELLSSLLASAPTVTVEDNPGYLADAYDAGSFCIAVQHGLSSQLRSPAHVTVRI